MNHLTFERFPEFLSDSFKEVKQQLASIQKRLDYMESNQGRNLEERLTMKEVCNEFKLSRTTVHKLMGLGELPFEKIGRATRFKREAVQDYFAKNRATL